MPISTHTLVPVAQDVIPRWQGLSDGVHSSFATQETIAPLLQTQFNPHDVPLATGVVGVEATQVSFPRSHEATVPWSQTALQEVPTLHAVHAGPASAPELWQYIGVPPSAEHVAPSGLLPTRLQTDVPVPQPVVFS